MTRLLTDDVLHVANGDSVAGTLRGGAVVADVVPWRDTLFEGPVPPISPVELARVRAGFFAGRGWGDVDVIAADLESAYRVLDEPPATVVLWLEHDLHDQLQLLQITARLCDLQTPPTVLLPDVSRLVERPGFHGLGELSAEELDSLDLVPLDPAALERAATAWRAFTSDDPRSLEPHLLHDPALPHLAQALRRLLEELPATGNGLSRLERSILRSSTEGPRTGVELFHAVVSLEERPFMGDAAVFARIAALESGPAPLLRSLAQAPPAGNVGERATELTPSGSAVLHGELDATALRGIDRWVGGCHLRPERCFRWDAAANRVVA